VGFFCFNSIYPVTKISGGLVLSNIPPLFKSNHQWISPNHAANPVRFPKYQYTFGNDLNGVVFEADAPYHLIMICHESFSFGKWYEWSG